MFSSFVFPSLSSRPGRQCVLLTEQLKSHSSRLVCGWRSLLHSLCVSWSEWRWSIESSLASAAWKHLEHNKIIYFFLEKVEFLLLAVFFMRTRTQHENLRKGNFSETGFFLLCADCAGRTQPSAASAMEFWGSRQPCRNMQSFTSIYDCPPNMFSVINFGNLRCSLVGSRRCVPS